MKKVLLLHNPGAGNEDHMKTELIKTIGNEGYECEYYAVKKEKIWKKQLNQAHLLILAGGDGTVRRVVEELLKKDELKKSPPMAILPMGTANNLSIALGVNKDVDNKIHIKNWDNSRRQRFDIGIINNGKFTNFFLEGAGYGIFPKLIQKMDALSKKDNNDSKDELLQAQEMLLEITQAAKTEKYKIIADEKIYEGHCFLLEVMNISSIGPNLILCPEAKISDGFFNIVCLHQEQREDFILYLKKLIAGEQAIFESNSIKAKSMTIDCESQYMHVDDELISPQITSFTFEIRKKFLEFLIPQKL